MDQYDTLYNMADLFSEPPLLPPLPLPTTSKVQPTHERRSWQLFFYDVKQPSTNLSPARPSNLWHYMNVCRITIEEVQSTVRILATWLRSCPNISSLRQYRAMVNKWVISSLLKQTYCPISKPNWMSIWNSGI